ncbi:MAG: hypothetical protein EP329_12415 [Deltaproteobacteria bacterium]|nr:MAG: hypothetical protein EP329_12415 [Deltaproteobacteria bacterium]
MADRPTNDPPVPDAPRDLSRRRFLGRAAVGAGACVGAGLLAAPTAMVLTPLVSDGPGAAGERWFRVGPLSAFPVGGPPTRIVLRADQHDAWMTVKNAPVGSVFVQRTGETELAVLSGVCPHLGCAIGYRADGDRFQCPCHGAAFARDGSLAADAGASPNPAPRPMDALSWRVRGDAVEVRWVRYRPGTAAQEEIA